MSELDQRVLHFFENEFQMGGPCAAHGDTSPQRRKDLVEEIMKIARRLHRHDVRIYHMKATRPVALESLLFTFISACAGARQRVCLPCIHDSLALMVESRFQSDARMLSEHQMLTVYDPAKEGWAAKMERENNVKTAEFSERCRRCDKGTIRVQSVQDRAGDESASIVYTCTVCAFRRRVAQ